MRVRAARTTAVLAVVAAVAIGVGQAPSGAAESVPAGPGGTSPGGTAPGPDGPGLAQQRDELPNRLEEKRRDLRERALRDVVAGRAEPARRGPSTVVKVGDEVAVPTARELGGRVRAARQRKAQYVELAREKTDRIFVILAEFGDRRHPDYPDRDTVPEIPGPATYDGPRHNAIPAPDRSRDNSTVWQADYSARHYRDLYFGSGESVRTYYEKQSSGRYSVQGTVSDWVRVPYNEARYGRSNGYPCAATTCSNIWALVRDAVDAWVADQRRAGRGDAEIRRTLGSYDRWDRYDFDADGNFNEPDGYLDHFQIVHAGGDQADGDPQQGEDAIWSHRWYAGQNAETGPRGNKLGGVPIGRTGLWVGDYTIQPENGGLSVFAHEYGHDLGLPDHYDTSGRPSQNPVNWWTVMAQSRSGARGDQGIGLKPQDLGTWDKLQLGWLDHVTVRAGDTKVVTLGPHEYQSKRPQGLVVELPKKKVTTDLVPPAAGERSWWSGQGDRLDQTLSRRVTLPAGRAALEFRANWKIEDCGSDACDYAYVEVDDGSGWKAVPGTVTKAAEANGIDGDSGGWVPARFDLSAYAGRTVGLRFRYATDAATHGLGFFADEIRVVANSVPLVTDGAEDGPNGWTAAGFRAAGASVVTEYDHYYLASNYTYTSYNRYLEHGPYSSVGGDRPKWVEHFPYADGLLVSYWDTSQTDNETAVHPGQGRWLPVDANAEPRPKPDGGFYKSSLQSYDSTFGLRRSDSLDLTLDGRRQVLAGRPAVRVFDDRRPFWSEELPSYGVKLPAVGVRIQVLAQDGTTMRLLVAR